MGQYVLINGRIYDRDELAHHGIKGMKWGVRRFQTKDGSLTPAGKKRYVTTAQGVRNANQAAKDARKQSLAESRATDSGIGSYRRAMNKASSAANEAYRNSIAKDKAYNKQLREEKKAAKENAETERKGLSDKQKEAIKIGAAVAGTAVVAYGAHKLSNAIKDKNFSRNMERGITCAEKWAENGKWEVGMSQIKAAYDSSYKQSVGDIVKRTIDNNSVNGKVDWRNVRKTLL